MGRIKTKLTKRLTFQLFKAHKEEFQQDFETNKKIVEKWLNGPSKKIRNVIAGYVTRLMKNKEELL